MKKVFLALLLMFSLGYMSCDSDQEEVVTVYSDYSTLTKQDMLAEVKSVDKPSNEFFEYISLKYAHLNKKGEEAVFSFTSTPNSAKDPITTKCNGNGWYVGFDDECYCWIYRRYSTTRGIYTFRFNTEEDAQRNCDNR